MNIAQSINYLETINSAGITAREMSPAMFRLARAAARRAASKWALDMAGYYCPEYEGARAEPWKFLFPACQNTIPQSERLQRLVLLSKHIPDQYRDALEHVIARNLES